MKNKDLTAIIIATLFLIMLVLVINPGMLWMPSMAQKTIAVLLLILFSAFAVYVWEERSSDEREQLHKLLAGHVAFLLGSSVLLIGVFLQALHGSIDIWLVGGLATMIVTKLVGMIWARRTK